MYRYAAKRRPLEPGKIEEIIKYGEVKAAKPSTVRFLGRIGDKGKKRPSFIEILCLMDEKLLAIFRSEENGIPEDFTNTPPDMFSKQHYAAWVTSQVMGLEMCPITAMRHDIPRFGSGTLTGMIAGIKEVFIFDPESGKYMVDPELMYRPQSLIMNLVFNYFIGSGQRDFSSFVVDPEGNVRSRYHHEAFTFTESGRLEFILSKMDREISSVFWNAMRQFRTIPMQFGRHRSLLRDLVSDEAARKFAEAFYELINDKRVGRQTIRVI
ncbi:hypothetical protein KKG46_00760 [Patescibacteria group bacterium]|nr:hypothetical protein [Patescibacteria group bacterium]